MKHKLQILLWLNPPDRALRLQPSRPRRGRSGHGPLAGVLHQTEWEPARKGGHLRHVGQALVQECHGSGSGNGATHEYGHLATSATWFAHNTLPSETMNYYQGAPGRILAQSAPKAEPRIPFLVWRGLDTNRESSLPIDDSGGSCDHGCGAMEKRFGGTRLTPLRLRKVTLLLTIQRRTT